MVNVQEVSSWTVEEVKDWACENYGPDIAEKFQGVLINIYFSNDIIYITSGVLVPMSVPHSDLCFYGIEAIWHL